MLSLRELAEAPWEGLLWRRVLEGLDEERRRRAEAMGSMGRRAACAGGGLLLQQVLWLKGQSAGGKASMHRGEERAQLTRFLALDDRWEPVLAEYSLEELLCRGEVFPMSYEYGPGGKPYMRGRPFYFNISHSGDYVICAVSLGEVGADIQQMRMGREAQIVERFFSGEEKGLWRRCGTEEERRELFYKLWTRKEAYGKLTGEGIGPWVGKDFSDPRIRGMKELSWWESGALAGYRIACCVREQ